MTGNVNEIDSGKVNIVFILFNFSGLRKKSASESHYYDMPNETGANVAILKETQLDIAANSFTEVSQFSFACV